MIEEMYMEEMKDQDDNNQASVPATGLRDINRTSNSNPNPSQDMGRGSTDHHAVEEKPTPTQLHNDHGSLSSIFSSSHRTDNIDHNGHDHNYGMINMDFNNYNGNNNTNNQGYGSGVSLTLGLQQHNRGAMNLSFSLASQSSLLYSGVAGEPIEEVPSSQFSIVDGDGQSVHYRNMVGTHLLHDLTG
jgi:hypothetical protein